MMRTILLIDVKQNPRNVIKHLSNFFVHRISLIDIKGLNDFRLNNIGHQLSNMHTSLGSLLRLALNSEKSTDDQDALQVELTALQNEVAETMFNEKSK